MRSSMIDFLKAKQSQLKLNDSEFAQLLGYTNRTTWYRAKKNPHELSPRFKLAAINRFPKLGKGDATQSQLTYHLINARPFKWLIRAKTAIKNCIK